MITILLRFVLIVFTCLFLYPKLIPPDTKPDTAHLKFDLIPLILLITASYETAAITTFYKKKKWITATFSFAFIEIYWWLFYETLAYQIQELYSIGYF